MFSLTDGMALEVFVVEGWPGDEVRFLPYYLVISMGCVAYLVLLPVDACCGVPFVLKLSSLCGFVG